MLKGSMNDSVTFNNVGSGLPLSTIEFMLVDYDNQITNFDSINQITLKSTDLDLSQVHGTTTVSLK
jgi:hypothetical protein